MLSRMNFSLTQLEYVLAVRKYGHFARAAEACHVTQPTLSMQIQKLEEDLGVILFDRSKKPILLTDAGKSVIDQIQSVLFEAKKIEELISAGKSEIKSGVLSVGIIPTIAPYLLPNLLKILDKKFPGIQMNIFELQTERIIEALNGDEIDVGILATPLKISKIHEMPLYYEPFSVLCRKGHELSKLKKVKHSALKPNDIWLLQEGHCLRNQVLDVCAVKSKVGPKRKYNFESGSLETLKNLVAIYGGYTLLPALATDHIGSNVLLIPFERPIPAREIGLVYRREHHKSELIEALSEAILDSIPSEIKSIRMKDLDVLAI